MATSYTTLLVGIRAKLDNLIGLEYLHDLIQILVVSDGSSDATEEMAAGYEVQPVSVHLRNSQ